MDPTEARTHSLRIALEAGVSIPSHLPLLDAGLVLRQQDDVVDRLLCLTAIAAAAYGFSKAKALAWLRQEALDAKLMNIERDFLERGKGRPQDFQFQVEGMWALSWAIGIVQKFNFWEDSDSRFVNLLPNLKVSQSSTEWRRKARLRSSDEIIAACDLSYCLHWAVRQAEIENNPPPANLRSHLVVERRRALEWLLSRENWDAISLDT